jgi:hypothetical protein
MFLAAFGLGWCGGNIWFLDLTREDQTGGRAIKQVIGMEDHVAIDAVVNRIIRIESDGDPNATNKRSSALGLGQFLDETWLDLIRTHRPDLARGRSKDETLGLRRDTKLAREITMRFTEQNAQMLRKRDLPVTPGTLYLAHFAGGAGAVAILSALDDADAASVMAGADVTGRTKREKIVQANSFLERFTVVDLKSWADRKMHLPGTRSPPVLAPLHPRLPACQEPTREPHCLDESFFVHGPRQRNRHLDASVDWYHFTPKLGTENHLPLTC